MMLSEEVRHMLNKSAAFKRLFLVDGKLTNDGRLVLDDLAKFCKANSNTVVISPVTRVIDTHASMINEGRREVYLRLTHYLKLDEADFLTKDELNDD